MRVISWNMGCSFGSVYKTSQPRTWQQLLAWNPDVALVQETTDPRAWLPEGSYVFSPYQWSASRTVEVGTLVYAAVGSLGPGPTLEHADLLSGQVTVVELSLPGDSEPWLVASAHAATKALPADLLDSSLDRGIGGSHTDKIYPVDLIRHDLAALTSGRRFIVGGDLNVSIRFDDLYTKSSELYGNVEWFRKARDAGWWNAHRKFHTGDQRTLFRPDKPDELLQIDHLFTDMPTWTRLSRCDVLDVPFLNELTDHAPLVLEVDGEPAA